MKQITVKMRNCFFVFYNCLSYTFSGAIFARKKAHIISHAREKNKKAQILYFFFVVVASLFYL
jgi:hypothetical protein